VGIPAAYRQLGDRSTSIRATGLVLEVTDGGLRSGGRRRKVLHGGSAARVPRTIPDYDTLFDPIRTARQAEDGNQIGDPARAARALLTVLDADKPPVHLVLGTDALNPIEQGRQRLSDDIAAWADLSASTSHPVDP
jgi:hypothetical protein